jgi:Transposase, Mutator family
LSWIDEARRLRGGDGDIGVVSIAAADHGVEVVSVPLAVVAAVALPVLIVATALAWKRDSWDLPDLDTAVALFTYVAACAVLVARFGEHDWVVWVLGAMALQGWVTLMPVVVRDMWRVGWTGLRERAHGGWGLASVATSGLAIVFVEASFLFWALIFWFFALCVYGLMTGLVLWRAVHEPAVRRNVAPDHWILMGGLAIATLAGDPSPRRVAFWPVRGRGTRRDDRDLGARHAMDCAAGLRRVAQNPRLARGVPAGDVLARPAPGDRPTPTAPSSDYRRRRHHRFADFPVPHWKEISNTNPLERLNEEIKRPHRRRRRLPNPAALLRLAGSVLVEAHDEWQVADKRYLSEIHPGPAQSHRPTRAEHLPPSRSHGIVKHRGASRGTPLANTTSRDANVSSTAVVTTNPQVSCQDPTLSEMKSHHHGGIHVDERTSRTTAANRGGVGGPQRHP